MTLYVTPTGRNTNTGPNSKICTKFCLNNFTFCTPEHDHHGPHELPKHGQVMIRETLGTFSTGFPTRPVLPPLSYQ